MEVTPPADTEMPHLADTETTALADSEALATDDMEVTPPGDTKVIVPNSTESSIHTDRGFPGGPTDPFVLTGYVDHVTFRLWKRKVYICYVEVDFIYY